MSFEQNPAQERDCLEHPSLFLCALPWPLLVPPFSGGYFVRTADPLSCSPDSYLHDASSSRCRHSSSAPDLRTAVQQSSPTSSSSGGAPNSSMLSQMLQLSSPSPPPLPPAISLSIRDCYQMLGNGHFQYVLGAATSIATKLHEETMTYLNQGQSYEIKLKKLGDLTEMRGKLLKSIIRVGFQERRLQYMEKQQIGQWQQQRVGERIVEIDIPLSYGVYDIVNDPQTVNLSEFLWDPTKETGVFVRVNCISTEFTPKKHGGEKGVPFRIQIETYSHGEGPTKRLHVASCQVKVFKPKGADRKHKTDREKMTKKPQPEQEKFQPPYDCTVLTECPMDSLYLPSPPPVVSAPSTTSSSNSSGNFSPQSSTSNLRKNTSAQPSSPKAMSATNAPISAASPATAQAELQTVFTTASSTTELVEAQSPEAPLHISSFAASNSHPMPSDATASEAKYWLTSHRFEAFVETFANFSGADILRLNRDDLIQICGLADGIRLLNALHSKALPPRLTVYVCGSEQVFRAVYLENLTVSDFATKLSTLLSLPSQSTGLFQKIFLIGPLGIRVLVTDEVIQNMADGSMFMVELLKDELGDNFRILLRMYSSS